MRQKGFTLIELMIAISIMAVVGVLGIVGFSNFNKAQVLQTSTNEVIMKLNLAKSRAQSQIKPSACPGRLDGYRVVISTPKSYILYVVCSGVTNPATDSSGDIEADQQNQRSKSLPADLNFSADSSFFFPVRTGGVQASGSGPWQITISTADGKTKIITVNSGGNIQ
jgi:prepilin-type N-terminal cleavage/methylation domain-containing protein